VGSTHEAISDRRGRAEPPSHSPSPLSNEYRISHVVDISVSARCSRLHLKRNSQHRTRQRSVLLQKSGPREIFPIIKNAAFCFQAWRAGVKPQILKISLSLKIIGIVSRGL
jgi:hypothetical protein